MRANCKSLIQRRFPAADTVRPDTLGVRADAFPGVPRFCRSAPWARWLCRWSQSRPWGAPTRSLARRPLQSSVPSRRSPSMCGIVGAIADRDVVPGLFEGLKLLQYRGSDSAGIAVVDEGERQDITLARGRRQ